MRSDECLPWCERITRADLVGKVPMSQYVGPLAGQLNASSWRSGTLRPFESMGSVGAKYIYLNRIRQREFRLLLLSYFPSTSRLGTCTIDVDGFRLNAFADLFQEPRLLVSTMSVEKLDSDDTVMPGSDMGLAKWSVDVLRYCPACIAQGYHSIWHQFPWLDECVFHLMPLQVHGKKIASPGKFSADLGLVQPLYEMWFESAGVWPRAKEPSWPLYNESSEGKVAAASRLQRQLRRVSRCFKTTYDPSPYVSARAPENYAILVSYLAGGTGKALRHLMRSEERNERLCSYTIKTNREHATSLIAVAGSIEDLCYLRRYACTLSDEMPGWKVVLHRWMKKTEGRHQTCINAFSGLYRTWGNGPGQIWKKGAPPPCLAALRAGFLPCLQLLLSEVFRNVFLKDHWNHRYLLNHQQYSGLSPELLIRIEGDFGPIDFPLIGDTDDLRQRELLSFFRSPQGGLAELCDAILLLKVWSWINAAIALDDSIDKSALLRISKEPELLSSMLQTHGDRFRPSYAIYACDEGVAVTGMVNFPFKMALSREAAGHRQLVLKKIQNIHERLNCAQVSNMLAIDQIMKQCFDRP